MICISTPTTVWTNPELILVGARRPKLLCINDRSESCQALTQRLQGYEIDVLKAPHGMQGYWLAMSEKPNVILMDVTIDATEGAQVLECLKKDAETAAIPVIVIADKSEAGLESRLLQLGAAQLLSQKTTCDEIEESLKKHVKLRQRAEN